MTSVITNPDGLILELHNPGQPWSPRSAREAILDTELGLCTYYLPQPHGWMPVDVAGSPESRHLELLDPR